MLFPLGDDDDDDESVVANEIERRSVNSADSNHPARGDVEEYVSGATSDDVGCCCRRELFPQDDDDALAVAKQETVARKREQRSFDFVDGNPVSDDDDEETILWRWNILFVDDDDE